MNSKMRLKKIAKKLVAWFPEKESVVEFEQAAKKQERIYDDAADYGILLDKANKKIFRDALKSLINFYGYTGEKWSSGQSWKIAIKVEEDEYRSGKFHCEILEITWNNDELRHKEFLTVDITSKSLSEKEIDAEYRKTGKGKYKK